MAQKLPAVGQAIGQISELGKTAYSAFKVMKNYDGEQLQSTEHLRRFNGAMQQAYSQLERDRVLREFNSTESTSGTTSAQANSPNRLEQQLRPLSDFVVNAKNVLGIATNTIAQIWLLMAAWNPNIAVLMKLVKDINEKSQEQKAATKTNIQELADSIDRANSLEHAASHRGERPIADSRIEWRRPEDPKCGSRQKKTISCAHRTNRHLQHRLSSKVTPSICT